MLRCQTTQCIINKNILSPVPLDLFVLIFGSGIPKCVMYVKYYGNFIGEWKSRGWCYASAGEGKDATEFRDILREINLAK